MNKPEDIKIGEYTLKEIIKRHHHWLEEDIEGWENMRADLRGVDLHDADLSDVNLSGADLHDVDLSYTRLYGAKLRGADLRGANLSGADLRNANLSGAKLRGANLSYADLRRADLNYANLRSVDLRDADLDYANLSDANLNGVDLRYAEGNLMEYRRGKILSESIIGYKKCRNNVIVTLEIPRGAIVFSINGTKCRTNKAKVLEIEGTNRAYSQQKYVSYYVGDEITIYNFNCEYNVECAEGIHFFMTRKEAKEYI